MLATLAPKSGLTIIPFLLLPSTASSSTKEETNKPSVWQTPFMQTMAKTSSPSREPRYFFIQTKDNYRMKHPESYTTALEPNLVKTPRERENFEFVTLQVSPFFTLEKKYEHFKVKDLLRPLLTNENYMDTDHPLKTRKYYEFILIDTGSIEIEHQLKNERDPDSILLLQIYYLKNPLTIHLVN